MKALARHSNNFDAVRLAAAFAVIVGHAPELTGVGDSIVVFGKSLHVLGVSVFFIMSGYLIATSWLRTPRLGVYFASRALRIFPGLIVVTTLSALLLGPIVSSLSVVDYLSNPGTWRYFLNIVLRPVYALPGVFTENPYPNSVNGSLWTLPVEFACYIAIPILLLFRRTRLLALVAATVGCMAVDQFMDGPLIIWGTDWQRAADLCVFFGVGAIVAVSKERLPLRLDVAASAVVVLALIVGVKPPAPVITFAGWILLPYIVLAFCAYDTPVLRRAARFGDLSYGLYIYAFPIQQVVVLTAGPLPRIANIVVVSATSVVLAYASWHLIERLALAAKPSRVSSLVYAKAASGAIDAPANR